MSTAKKPFIVVFVCLLFSVTVSAQSTDRGSAPRANRRPQRPPALQPTRADVAYGPHQRNRIDFYRAQSEEATPLVVYIHGGGFRGGSKRGINQKTLQQLLDAGISVAAIEYRLVPEYPLPIAHQDSLRALQFIRAQAQAWNIDKQRVAAFGGSAGAQICMWLAFHDETADPENYDPIKRESSRLCCVATNGGQTTMDFSWWKQHIPGYNKPHRPQSEYFGDMDDGQHARTIKDISAQSLITADDPPIWMSYGMAPDAPIPSDPRRTQGWKVHHVAFGVRLKQMMDQLGIESHLSYPGKQVKYKSMADFFIAKLSLAGQDYPRIIEADRLSMLTHPNQRPVRMVLDTDTYNEIDDQFALVYALISPELDVQAVYAAPFKNKRADGPREGMEKSYEEILRILGKLNQSAEGFAFKGSTRYLTDLKKPEKSGAAMDLVRRARQSSPEDPLYVVPVGAITNISNAILIDPSIIRNIVVVWLGGNGHHWPHQREFNFRQDLNASRLVFDCGVPFVQLPCRPVVTHFTTTVPEMERYVGGQGAIGDYLLKIFKAYRKDHFGWSKVLWDMTAVAWLVNDEWLPSDLVHSPIVTDNYTYSFDDSRHLIRTVKFVHRDPIYRDFFTKLEKHSLQSPQAH